MGNLKQQKFFVISIIIIGLISAIFYVIRYNSLTIDFFSKYPYLMMEGTFSAPIDPKRIELLIKAFPLKNISLFSISNLTYHTNENQANINSTTAVPNLTDDTSLINTLTKIIISKFNTSYPDSPLSLGSNFLDMKVDRYNATGTWNASILQGRDVNFSAQIHLQKVNKAINTYFIKLKSNARDKVDIIQGKNDSILINGIGEIKIEKNTFKIPVVLVLSKMKDIYLYLPTSLRDISNPDLSLAGKIDKNKMNIQE